MSDALKTMINSIINGDDGAASASIHEYITSKVRQSLLSEDVMYDKDASQEAADKLVDLIKNQFNVDVTTGENANGSVSITANNGRMVDNTDPNPSVLNLKNLRAAIDVTFKEFAEKGWLFTAPVKGNFTIGVPSGANQ